MTTRVGTHLDRYEIDAELGRGAMGVVYRARDVKLDRTVAIKMISLAGLEPDAEQEYRLRFVLEARAAGRLSHAGIVTIFDVREEEETGAPYLVMEYIEGQSLQKLVTRENRTLPLSTTLKLAQEIAEALHYAHTQGVVHRDIKPANILVDADGHTKITDFGIAKLNQNDVTLPGQVLGSPSYMAPEQLSDEGGDARSDLFSLGVVLYYMLTGHRPFQGNSTDTVCFKVVNYNPLPVSAFQFKCSPELDNIVLRAIAKDPEQRYQTGMALASDLQQVRDASGFCDPKAGDWTIRSLKRGAIPRYVSAGEKSLPTDIAPNNEQIKSADRFAPAAKARSEPATKRKAPQPKGPRLSWVFLVFSVLAVALAFVAFWSRTRSKRELVGVLNSQSAAPHNTITAEQSHSDTEPTVAKALAPQRKVARPRAKAGAAAAEPQTPAATNPTAALPANVTLQIEIEHQFTDAHAMVWLDNVLVYTQSLQAGTSRRALLFRRIKGHHFEVVKVPMGKHEVRVRIQSVTDSYDQSKTIAKAFIRNEGRLRIICDKKHDDLHLTLH